MSAARLFAYVDKVKAPEYLDRKYFGNLSEQNEAKQISSTVYVGNLSFYTSETQLYFLFTFAGFVDKIIMGLHSKEKTPCGFCFVQFKHRKGALNAINLLNGLVVDGKKIKVELDPGFKEGRQFGRGETGGQKQDERRTTEDPHRGGEPPKKKTNMDFGNEYI